MSANKNSKPLPRVLTIAGSDPSCGSGIQADLRVLSRSGVVPCSVVTAVTAQSRDSYSGAHLIPAESIAAQIEAVMIDGVPAATKIGMLGSAEAVRVVCEAIDRWELKNVVLDPVLRSTSDGELLDPSALERLKNDLLPRVSLVTPNLDEAGAFVGFGARNEEAMRSAAASLVEELHAPAALIKGGHLDSTKDVFDILQIGDSVTKLSGGKFAGSPPGGSGPKDTGPRGTGCILSASIAIHLARGDDLETSVRKARGFVRILVEGASLSLEPRMLAIGDGFYIQELEDA